MSSDPFDINFDFGAEAYDNLIAEADRDDRVGDHRFLVTEVNRGKWPDGQPQLKVKGVLVTADNAKTDWTFSPPPSAETLASGVKMEKKMQKAIASAITMARQLTEHYTKTPGQIKAGDEFNVKTVKTRYDEKTQKGGFIRIIAFLPKDAAVGGQGASGGDAANTAGF